MAACEVKKSIFLTILKMLRQLLKKQNFVAIVLIISSVLISCVSSHRFVELGIAIDQHLVKRESLFNFKFFIRVLGISCLGLAASLLADLSTSLIFHNSLTCSLTDIMKYKFEKFHSFSTGDLMNRQYEKGECISKFFYSFFVNSSVSFFTIYTLISKISQDSDANLHRSLIIGSIMHLTVFFVLNRPSVNLEKKYFNSKSKTRSLVENESKNFSLVKVFNIEKTSISRVSSALEDRRKSFIAFTAMNLQKSVIFKLIELFVHFFFYYLYSKGLISNDGLLFKINLIISLFEKLRLLIEYLNEISSSAYMFQHIDDSDDVNPGQLQTLAYFDNISLENVSFDAVLTDVNININKCEKIAIFGPNNSGKSLLLNIIAGLVPSEGKVLVNGVPIEKISKKSLFDVITIVFQDDFYIQGSVIQNLGFGNNYSRDMIIRTCQYYGTDEVFSNLPNGYDQTSTSLGEEFSGGQRQRIGFMRGVLRNTPVLLIDDCLSSVNTKDKSTLIDQVTRVEGKTVVMVCNESELLSKFDKILYIKDGSVISTTPEKLRDMVDLNLLIQS